MRTDRTLETARQSRSTHNIQRPIVVVTLDVKKRGVVAVIRREERLLVIRRSQHVVAPGALCFPGGAIEAGETEESALIRELQEELNVEVRPQRRIWQSVTPWQVAISWWQAELAVVGTPVPNPAEVASVHWMTLDELRGSAELLESNHAFLEICGNSDFFA